MHGARFCQTLPFETQYKGIATSVRSLPAASCDCQREHSKWDKLFIMLENSQMKENMMLQALEELPRADLQTLKAELSQLTSTLVGTFATVTSHVVSQVEQVLVRSRDQAEEARRLQESEQGKVLEHVLQLSHNVSVRLGWLESAWRRRAEEQAQETALQQDKFDASRGDDLILNSVWKELQQTRAELRASQQWAAQHLLPGGKSGVLHPRALGRALPNRDPQTPPEHLPLQQLQSNLRSSRAALNRLCIKGGTPELVGKEALSFSNVG